MQCDVSGDDNDSDEMGRISDHKRGVSDSNGSSRDSEDSAGFKDIVRTREFAE